MANVKEEAIDLKITKDDLLRLSQYHNSSCISIYIPTHHYGEEMLKGQDAINLKNQVKEIRNKLALQGLTSREIEKLVNPVLGLADDADFWRHQSDGLAVFVSDGIFEKYTVPVTFEEHNYLSSEFYIKQLFPLFNTDGFFYLLTLKKDDVRFYEGNKYGLSEVDMQGLIPTRIEDSVGYDFEQKQLQFRTQLGGNKPGTFHGHGEGEAKNKNELLTFFREIDRGIMTKLHDNQEPPLLLCCIEYYYPIYREASAHRNIYPKYVSYDPASLDINSLHEKAWKSVQPYFDREFRDRKEKFMIAHDKGKSSSDIREIVPSAIMGKIDTLFIEKNTEIFGIYDPVSGTVEIHEEHTMSSVSLMNLSAKKVFEQGGLVYLLEKNEMPDGLSGINALFRY